MESNEFYSSKDYKPGLVEAAARHFLFDRIGELKEREANLKLITEQQKKKSLNSESPSKGSPNQTVAGEKTLKGFLLFILFQVNIADVSIQPAQSIYL